MAEVRICPVCNSKFYPKTEKQVYCQISCAILKKPFLKQVCLNCGKTFYEQRKLKYCSNKCRNDYHKLNKPKKYLKICEFCCKRFNTSDKKQRFCCLKCSSKYFGERQKKYKICKNCGKLFWDKNNYRKKYCCEDCRYENYRKRFPIIEKTIYKRKCRYCSSDYKTTKSNQLFCTKLCSYEYYKQKDREKYAEDFVPKIYKCKNCNAQVTTSVGDRQSKFCSKNCAEHFQKNKEKMIRNIQMKKQYVEDVLFEEIYERDKGICQICGKRVIKDTSKNDAWGAVIDHRVALSNKGKHSKDNCQLAHRICNSIKNKGDPDFKIDWNIKAEENIHWKKRLNDYYYV